MEYEEFVALTVLAAGVGCDRKGIKTKVCRLIYGQAPSADKLRSSRVPK